MLLSVCIVTHNNLRTVGDTLRSLACAVKGISAEIFVVDNDSDDGTPEYIACEFKNVRLIKMNRNKGFGSGHNAVLPFLESEYHLILNPDVVLNTGTIHLIVKYMNRHKDVLLLTPEILNFDGTIQLLPQRTLKISYLLAGRFEKNNNFFRRKRAEYTQKEHRCGKTYEIDFASGCFMMIRTEIFRKIHGFDERFFLYFEDADLTRRVKKYGKCVYFPHSSVYHSWARASMKSKKYFAVQVHSMLKYYSKWIFSRQQEKKYSQ